MTWLSLCPSPNQLLEMAFYHLFLLVCFVFFIINYFSLGDIWNIIEHKANYGCVLVNLHVYTFRCFIWFSNFTFWVGMRQKDFQFNSLLKYFSNNFCTIVWCKKAYKWGLTNIYINKCKYILHLSQYVSENFAL